MRRSPAADATPPRLKMWSQRVLRPGTGIKKPPVMTWVRFIIDPQSVDLTVVRLKGTSSDPRILGPSRQIIHAEISRFTQSSIKLSLGSQLEPSVSSSIRQHECPKSCRNRLPSRKSLEFDRRDSRITTKEIGRWYSSTACGRPSALHQRNGTSGRVRLFVSD